MKTKKRLIVSTMVVLVVVILAAGLFVTQVGQPLRCSVSDAKIYTNSTPDSPYAGVTEDDYDQARQGLAPYIQLLSDEDYDFTDPADFSEVNVFYDVTNTSVLPINSIEFFVLDLGGGQGRFLYKSDAAVPQNADPGETISIRLDVSMYVKGLSDDEVAKLVAGLRVELQYQQSFLGGRNQDVSVPADLKFSEHVIS